MAYACCMITADRRCEDVRMIQPRIAARLPLLEGREAGGGRYCRKGRLVALIG
jgi:hypothetical protein